MDPRMRCFVLMGFGEKVDYRTNRKLDLDKTYKIIRKAVEDAGLVCIRADDIVHSGVIDRPMYEHLLNAEVAIADLSTSNENAIYELGVRHALKPFTTIIIAESQFKFPFDLGHVVIRPYTHLGSGIDFEEADRLRAELIRAIQGIVGKNAIDSPVYEFLHGLRPPALVDEGTAEAAPVSANAANVSKQGSDVVFSTLLDAFKDARKNSDFVTARTLVVKLRALKPGPDDKPSMDPFLVQQHAFVTYMSKQPTTLQALEDAKAILESLEPDKTGDAETLGLWGAVHKRLWDETGTREALDQSVFAYARGFYIKRDYYTGINYAFVLDDRARKQDVVDECIADRVLARRTRRQVLGIVEAALAALPNASPGQVQDPTEKYWLEATRVEALLGLGDPRFEEARANLFATAPEQWMNQTTQSQLTKLAGILKNGVDRTAAALALSPGVGVNLPPDNGAW
jgi:hypothetical protein